MAEALRDIDGLPGPPGWPLVGNLFQVERAHVHRHVEGWARQYGALFRFQLGKRRFIGVADHELVQTVLRDRPDGYRRTKRFEQVGREMGLAPGVFGSNGDAWRRQRRMVMAGLEPATVKAYYPALVTVAERLRKRWVKAGDAPIDLQADLMRFTVDVVTGLALGSDVNTLESDGDVIQRHLDKIFPALFRRIFAPLPYWRVFKLPADWQLEHSVAEVNAAVAGFIAMARQRLRDEPARRDAPRNLLEAMLVDAGTPGSEVGDSDIAGNVLNMLLAGEDTTANSLAWMIYLLSRHPDALQRAAGEVRQVLQAGQMPTAEQLAGFDVVEACMHETMRLKPVAPFIAVQANQDTTLADVRVPAGTLVWCVMRHDSLDERYFADAAAFEPQRWLDDAAGSSSSAKRISMPFGAGARVCPGRYLAMQEMKLVMAMLLANFDIAGVDTPDGGQAQEAMAVTLAPVGLKLRLQQRR